MPLAGSQSNQPRLPPLPQRLPQTQQDWDRVVNALQQWRTAMQPKWITPVLQNGWAAYGAPYEQPGFYMDVTGCVHIRGLVKGGTVGGTTPLFTLPAPYVPPYTLILPAMSLDALCEIRILGSGDTAPGAVTITSGGNNGWVSLSGISFSTTP